MPDKKVGESAAEYPASMQPSVQPIGNQELPPQNTYSNSQNNEEEPAKLTREIREIKIGEKWLIGIAITTLLINTGIGLIYNITLDFALCTKVRKGYLANAQDATIT